MRAAKVDMLGTGEICPLERALIVSGFSLPQEVTLEDAWGPWRPKRHGQEAQQPQLLKTC